MNVFPTSVLQKDNKTLTIDWNDGTSQDFDVVNLRRLCPCADCVDEMSGVRKLDPSSVSETVRPTHIKSVGNYAMNLEFSDGHRTGFYTFEKLHGGLES